MPAVQRISGFLLLLAASAGCSRRSADPPAPKAVAQSPGAPSSKPAVLVELFTSEGCSSCPPADRNLSRIVRNADPRVIALSFHVDYWNYLGWRDPFSTALNSERQRQHARMLGGGVYTPEMVINGRDQVLGSDEDSSDSAIEHALGRAPTASLEFDARWAERVTLTFRATAPAGDASVCFALAESARDVDVTSGENRGEKLSHDNVVRGFECQPFRSEGSAGFARSAVDPERALIVGWVEDAHSHAVLGLARS